MLSSVLLFSLPQITAVVSHGGGRDGERELSPKKTLLEEAILVSLPM